MSFATTIPETGTWVHPCLSCGACCAHFRASFYWAEADDQTPGGVPVALTNKLTPHLRVMKGTDSRTPRCIALRGEIGGQTFCAIHPMRASTCREFPPSLEDGTANERCDGARQRWGLQPLTAADWAGRDQPPEIPPGVPPEPPPELPAAA